MEKKMNNKGFSLVELIIVVAIMAVLIGVLAPAYLQYVEKSKKTSDCTAIGGVMDAIEIVAADPAITWSPSEVLTIDVPNSSTIYSGGNADVVAALEGIVASADCTMSSGWTGVTFTATKQSNGTVQFSAPTLDVPDSGKTGKESIEAISPALGKRFE